MSKFIPLTNNKAVLVDNDDYEWLSQWKWRAIKRRHYWYAVRTFYFAGCTHRRYNKMVIAMHTLIMVKHFGYYGQVDHKNHNTLDNRKEELRTISGAENQWNMRRHKESSSRFKGVSWNKHAGKYHAQIGFHKKNLHIGYFENEIEAAREYDKYANELYGEYSCLNLPVSSNSARQSGLRGVGRKKSVSVNSKEGVSA